MIDYKSGLDVGWSDPIVYNNSCYFLTISVYNGFLFTYMPIDLNQIDTQAIKLHSYLLQQFQTQSTSKQFYWTLYQNSNNIDTNYNSLIVIIWQKSSIQISLSFYNSTSLTFEQNIVINYGSLFSFNSFWQYNTTLLYLWGGIQNQQPYK